MQNSNKMKQLKNLIMSGVLLGVVTAQADTLIEQSFDAAAPGSNVPAGWTAVLSAGAVGDVVKTPVEAEDGKKWLRIERNDASGINGSAAVYYTGSQGEVSNGQIMDFESEMNIRWGGTTPQTSAFHGIVLRSQSLDFSAQSTSTFWGYTVGFIASGDNAGLYLYENPTGNLTSQRGLLLDSALVEGGLSRYTTYVLKVAAAGATITASLWSADGATELVSISYDDAVQTGGYFGLWGANSQSFAWTEYRDLKMNVTAVVPEPVTAVIPAAAFAFVVWMALRRHRRD